MTVVKVTVDTVRVVTGTVEKVTVVTVKIVLVVTVTGGRSWVTKSKKKLQKKVLEKVNSLKKEQKKA